MSSESKSEQFKLEPPEPANNHICAELARLLGFRLDRFQEACDELHGWTLKDELNQPTDKSLWFFPVENTVHIDNDEGNRLAIYKLNITLTQL